MKKERIFNFRPIFYCFIALALGIYLAKYIFDLNIYVLLILGISIFLITYLSVKYKCVKRLILIVSSFVLGIGIFLLSFYTFTNNNFVDGNYTVSGRISVVNDYSGMQTVVLDKLYIDGNKAGNHMVVSVKGANTMEVGYVITFTGTVKRTKLFNLNKFNNYYYKYGIAYTAQTYESDVTMDSFTGLTVSEALRKSVKGVLDKNMDQNEASISYASLFGDKTFVNDDVKNSFSISGIAHLLAVSGLHVGFVTTLLLFVLNKTKLKKYINLIIIGVILAFYCYLCSFSVSVVRASIMFLVLSIANILGKQYDKLNSIGLAGIIVLIYKPLSVYDAGFLLSFGSVLSIFMFSVYFKQLFKEWHMPQKLASTLATMLSVQIGLLPLTIYYYGQISILNLLANFICIPVFEIFFMSLFVITPLVLILPFLAFLLKIPGIIIAFVIKVAQIISDQKWAVINLSKISPLGLLGVYFMFFVTSHFINLSKVKKVNTCSFILLVTLLITLGVTTPLKFSQNVAILNSYNSYIYVVELNGVTFCVGDYDLNTFKTTTKYFDNVVYKDADYLLIENDYSPYTQNGYANVYNFADEEKSRCLKYNKEYTLIDVQVTSYKINNKKCGVLLEYDGIKIFVGNKKLTFNILYDLNRDIGKIDLLLANSDCLENFSDLNIENAVVNGTYVLNDNNSRKFTGDWTISLKSGKIETIRSIDWTFKNYKLQK